MRIRTLVSAAFAFIASAPAGALAAVTVTASIAAPAGGAPAGSTVQVTCTATGVGTTTGMLGTVTTQVAQLSVAVTNGAVSPGQLPGGSTDPVQGTTNWTLPPAASTESATCTAQVQTTNFVGTSTSSVSSAPVAITTTAPVAPPPVVDAFPQAGPVLAGGAVTLTVTAHDPTVPPGPLTYSWRAAAGTITPDPANPAAATWVAPATPGSYDVSVDVTSAAGTTTVTQTIPVALAVFQASVAAPFAAPRRLAASPTGELFVVDGARGTVHLLTRQGQAKGFTTLPERAVAVAAGPGMVFVSTVGGRIFKVDAHTGAFLGEVPLAGGKFIRPMGMAYDADRMVLWVADTEAGTVRRIHPDGTTVSVISAAGGMPLYGPVDVALDASGNRAWVAVVSAKAASELLPTDPPQAVNILHGYDLDGNYATSTVGVGGGAGQVTRAGGLAVAADGKVYVSDTFQGAIQVMSRGGAAVATLGGFGNAGGQLHTPTGLAVLGNGDLAVANTSTGRVDRFGTGQPLPACPGDSDCDGLPDWWEIKYGLNPNFAGDAMLDPDGDGLNNLQEFALGTNPRKWDTDGDGFSDGEEVASGYNPLDASDHLPALAVTGPTETDPGLVRLLSTASTRTGATCAVTWNLLAAPDQVTLSQATGGVSFVARRAGSYDLQAVATCGAAAASVKRSVVVRDVPPLADATRVVVTEPGQTVGLSGQLSSDANGDALAFRWDEVLGAALSGGGAGANLSLSVRGPGYYEFQLTATDPAGNAGTATVPVLVAAGAAPTAVVEAVPAAPAAGATVTLDGSASYVNGAARFVWTQLEGRAVQLASTGAVARFVPPLPGHYAFELIVVSGGQRSPPARVDLYASAPGAALPKALAAVAPVVDVGAASSLDGSASVGAGLSYAWRQVSGPAAGLTASDRAVATVVPFAPGWHVFELTVSDDVQTGVPVRVAFEARAGGAPIPVASPSATPAAAMMGQLVFLSGKGSTGAARYRWTQVEGPWTALSAPTSAVTVFRPQAPGLYGFELEVDDGAARSAPVRVNVLVVANAERNR